MGFLSDLWDGMVTVLDGVVSIIIGIFELAFAVAVMIVKTVFTAAKHLTRFAVEVVNSLFGTNKKVEKVTIAGPEQTKELWKELQRAKQISGVVMGEPIDVANKALLFAEGTNEFGEDDVLVAKFVDAYGYENKLKDADERGRFYEAPVRC